MTSDLEGNLYVVEEKINAVSKWSPGSSTGQIVAGGNGRGDALNQLNLNEILTFSTIVVDSKGNLYIPDENNHRVVKWNKGSNEGIVVAGGNGRGDALNQLISPTQIKLDSSGNLYINDRSNNRIVKWEEDASEGVVVAGGNGQGSNLNQFNNAEILILILVEISMFLTIVIIEL
jgi:sugar lactone lactonase YvrE